MHPALIKPRHFRFDSDEMEVNEIKLFGVRFVRAEAVTASQTDPPGRKPGQNSPKDLACGIVSFDVGRRSATTTQTPRPAS